MTTHDDGCLNCMFPKFGPRIGDFKIMATHDDVCLCRHVHKNV